MAADMANIVKAAVIQIPVTTEPDRNVERLAAAAARLEPGTLAVAPEGALSGYLPQPGFVTSLDTGATERAIEAARKIAAEQQIHLIAGACIHAEGVWRNSSFYMGPAGELERYDKINLAQSERGTFAPGSRLPVYDIAGRGTNSGLAYRCAARSAIPNNGGCWRRRGSVIAYVNNAVTCRVRTSGVRTHQPGKTQRFVLGANNADAGQICPV
jgi:hypothetical protein